MTSKRGLPEGVEALLVEASFIATSVIVGVVGVCVRGGGAGWFWWGGRLMRLEVVSAGRWGAGDGGSVGGGGDHV